MAGSSSALDLRPRLPVCLWQTRTWTKLPIALRRLSDRWDGRFFADTSAGALDRIK